MNLLKNVKCFLFNLKKFKICKICIRQKYVFQTRINKIYLKVNYHLCESFNFNL